MEEKFFAFRSKKELVQANNGFHDRISLMFEIRRDKEIQQNTGYSFTLETLKIQGLSIFNLNFDFRFI